MRITGFGWALVLLTLVCVVVGLVSGSLVLTIVGPALLALIAAGGGLRGWYGFNSDDFAPDPWRAQRRGFVPRRREYAATSRSDQERDELWAREREHARAKRAAD